MVVRANGENGKIGFHNVRNATESVPGIYAEINYRLR